MHKKNRGEIDMKILRIDRQGALNGAVYKNLKDLKESLIDYHSMDYDDHFDEDEEYKPIEKFTLDEILDWGEWDYEKITDEQAKQYDDHR